MDKGTCETSRENCNLCCVFSSWKIFGALEKLTSAQAQLRLKVDMITGKRSEDMNQTKDTWLAEAKNLLLHAEILKTEINDAKQFFIWKQTRKLSNKFAEMTIEIRRKLEDADEFEAKPIVSAVGDTVQQKDDQDSSSSSSPLSDELEAELVASAFGETVQQKDDQDSSSSSSPLSLPQKYDQDSSSSSSPLSLPKKCYILSEFARQAAFEIMEALQDNNVKLIGLVGMGLVGKTALAVLMGMKAKELGMFDVVVKVSGRSSEGYKPDLRLIRSDIAKALDSQWNDREVGENSGRASELICGIVNNVEKILIILDDVWEVIDLKAIEIPLGDDHRGCKILLTTRMQHVCRGFGCQKIVHLRETGDELDFNFEKPSFKVFNLGCIPFLNYFQCEKVKSLEQNYDYLNDWKMQSFFLLCSHFPRKYAPTVEELTRYGIGQGLFNDYKSIEGVRKEAHLMVSSLQSSSIVEEEEDCIWMCNSFHMLALWVEKFPRSIKTIWKAFCNKLPEHETIKFLASRTTIFLQTSQFSNFGKRKVLHKGRFQGKRKVLHKGRFQGKRKVLQEGLFKGYKFFNLKFSNLQTLTIIEDDDGANFYEDRRFNIGSHMMKLNVLCLQAKCFPSGDWAENPPTLSLEMIENLKDLQTLQVKGYKVKGVSSLEKLNKLKILGFLGCTFEDKLPESLGELDNLKMLDFSYCVELHQQSQKWILQLSKLEELYITDVSLESWSRSGFLQQLQERNPRLNLAVLSPEVNSEFSSQQFVVPKFASYRIELINMKEGKVEFDHFKPISSSKILRIKALPTSPFVELFKDIDYLHLMDCHNIGPSLDKGGLSGLQDLRLYGCKNLVYLIDEEGIGGDLVQGCAFSNLTNLELVGLAALTSLWKDGGHMINLENLRNFQLRNCHRLTGYIFSKSIIQSLQQLEILEISGCGNLEAVLEQCSHPDGPICLPKLVTVKISMVRQLRSIFPSYVAEGLPELRELQVCDCEKLGHVFISSKSKVNEKNELDHCYHLELPQLRILVLRELCSLKTFCRGKNFIVTPLLEDLQVDRCQHLKPFTLKLNNDMLPGLKKLCLGRDVGSEVPKADVAKAYTKMSKWSTSRPHFIIGTRPFDSLGTYFLSNLKELKVKIRDLKVLWKDSTISGLQNLTHLSLDGCGSLEYVFTPLSVHNVPNLKCLRIEDCDELGQIVAEDETTTEAHGQQHRPIWFPNLTDIYLEYCGRLSNVFPARLAGQLPKFKRLQVVWMSSLTQIFGSDRDSKETCDSKVVQLPLLQNLILKNLSNMARFAPEGFHFMFPALDHLEVKNCAKMQTSFYATGDRGVCAIIESGEIRQRAVDYTQPMNAAVAVPIFSGNNYDRWRNKMMTYFKSQDLWEVVAQGIKAPLKETPYQKKKDAQALFVIQNAVLDPIYSKIIGATSARDAWLKLEEMYSTAIDPYILELFSGNEQEAERWREAKRLDMDADNNILWPDGRTASEHQKPVIVDLTDPNGLLALDLI